MRIRRLKEKDARLMLEWMHDSDVVQDLYTDFASKTLEDCLAFISSSRFDKQNIHYAIVSDKDEYMGTVSLKHIDRIHKCAEFGIAVRKEAMGKGYSWFGMKKLFEYAFTTCRMKYVYWCVSEKNARACRFYDKHHFSLMKDIPQQIKGGYESVPNLRWYIARKGDLLNYEGKEICGCKILSVKTIGTVGSGELSFFESSHDIPFDFKRIYYITKVPEGIRRGFHAHKELKQFIFCPYGKIELVLDNGENREEILLDDSSIGVLIEKPIWREMVWVEAKSVLCVVASDYYSEQDYIRDYKSFLDYLHNNH